MTQTCPVILDQNHTEMFNRRDIGVRFDLDGGLSASVAIEIQYFFSRLVYHATERPQDELRGEARVGSRTPRN